MGDLGKALKSRFSIPFSGTTRHSGNTIATEECVGFFYRAGGNSGSYDSDTNNSSFSGHPMLPGSVCGVAPAPSGTCDFTQQVLTLDHGVLARQELEGNEVTETVNLTCSLPMTLKLYIFDADKLELRSDGSLYSELYINDSTPGEDGLTIDVSDQTQVSVKSMLHTNGSVEAGEFSGSTVMMITVE
jgi:hypothetical protein